MTGLPETTDLLAELIAYPTVSPDSNLDMIACLATRLDEAGASVEVLHDESGRKANLFARIGPEVPGGIMLSGHTDVVPAAPEDWQSDPFAMRADDARLYGRGACDMKGFIAASVAMAPLFAERELTKPLYFAFTHDEEVGCLGAQSLVEALRGRDLLPDIAIVGEPTEMRIIEGHKGCCEYSTHFRGLAGHGSSPDHGVNAVEFAVRYVNRLMELKEALKTRAPADSLFEPPWTTINTGALSGGVAHNVIPGHAQVDWEMRPVQKSDADFVRGDLWRYCEEVLLPAMRSVSPEATIETEVVGEVQGLIPASENEARDIIMELTGANGAGVVPFGTEAGLFQDLGMSVVVCGPGCIDQAHKPDEYVDLTQMGQCLGLLERLSEKLS
ncbi:acetylornithine deacetylase [Rhodobacteraceae bacterium W635]|uniref:acetylornithine deacetylase n=1 Tax=Nioella halotolerans TaxID=2303578 RepID=UPI000E3DD8B9|nr:acetylornithine deacetylase [Rhodobacteraceae bacterium W635]